MRRITIRVRIAMLENATTVATRRKIPSERGEKNIDKVDEIERGKPEMVCNVPRNNFFIDTETFHHYELVILTRRKSSIFQLENPLCTGARQVES